MSVRSKEGFLIIGDISGYTSYVARTELEHSQAVLTELLELIVNHIQPLLHLVKLEGDAVFAHAPIDIIQRGESLLEMIETTYVSFRGRVEGIVRNTTCTCRACQAIPTLDLKFMAHYGDYIIQHVSGIDELVGSDVNLLHRLTKNHVHEATGWDAYALFTGVCLEHLGLEPNGLHHQMETYEHFGEVDVYCLDLRQRYKDIIEKRHVFLTPEEADVSHSIQYGAPPAIVWEWLTDPQKRNQYQSDVKWMAASRPGGRTGIGATNHCAHGNNEVSAETILDWRPFEYFTVSAEPKLGQETMFDSIQTFQLEPGDEASKTTLHWRGKLKQSNILTRFMFRQFAKNMAKMLRSANALIEEEMQRIESVAPQHNVAERIASKSVTS